MHRLWLSLVLWAGCSAIPPNPAKRSLSTDPPCVGDEDCSAEEYCDRDQACDGEGACRVRPEACAEILKPVCGCDGRTWSNECVMQHAGVSKASDGACASVCSANADCAAMQYCARPDGACAAQGECRLRPLTAACADLSERVCGCDGVTYGSACEAARAGASIANAGSCAPIAP